MDKYIADANIGLRLLVGSKDIATAKTAEHKDKLQEMFDYTVKVAEKVEKGEVSLLFPDAVIEEMVFTLKSYYNLDRDVISASILELLEVENVESSATVRETLRQFATVNLDFVDIKLGVLSTEQKLPVLTWDKGFKKLNGCEHYAPSEII